MIHPSVRMVNKRNENGLALLGPHNKTKSAQAPLSSTDNLPVRFISSHHNLLTFTRRAASRRSLASETVVWVTMKLSTKPISSPGRAEKFPPPLMRFLRSNAGSRSRGRSRTSPMFVRKKNTAIETQEPSSPKVTCMGQVRVRRPSKQAASKRPRRAGDGAKTSCRCRWIRKFLFCHRLATKNKPKPCQPVWPKWSFCRVGSFGRKPTKVREDSHSSQTESNFRDRCSGESGRGYEELEEEEYEERAHDNVNDNVISFVHKPCTPPKNALLLTRCRSAPYRSSSLANRLWGSPLRSEETEQEQRTGPENRNSTESDELTEQGESTDKESEEKLRLCRELRDSVKERLLKFENSQEFRRRGGGEGDSIHPLVLTRCKSEPRGKSMLRRTHVLTSGAVRENLQGSMVN